MKKITNYSIPSVNAEILMSCEQSVLVEFLSYKHTLDLLKDLEELIKLPWSFDSGRGKGSRDFQQPEWHHKTSLMRTYMHHPTQKSPQLILPPPDLTLMLPLWPCHTAIDPSVATFAVTHHQDEFSVHPLHCISCSQNSEQVYPNNGSTFPSPW